MEKTYWISMPYACYGIIVKDNKVLKAPPIASWMVGKEFDPNVRNWLSKKKAILTDTTG